MNIEKRLEDFRKHKDEYFASGAHSPLDPSDQAEFQGLAYFPFDPALRFEVEIEAASNDAVEVMLDTSDQQTVPFLVAGTVRFPIGESTFELTLLKDLERGRFFLPFHDATNGTETYAGGRYIDPQLRPNGKLSLDFNYAYNPYCAYDEGWSCPLPPAANQLAVAIRAGERSFLRGQQ